MVDDPILQLERALLGARLRRRRRVYVIPALVAAAALALFVLTRPPAPSLAATAYAHLTNGIVYLKTDTEDYNAGKLYGHTRAELWYRGPRVRSIGTSIGPRSGRAVRYLEVVRDGRTIVSYESGTRSLTTQALCRSHPTADPLATFRALLGQGRVHEAGTGRFDGKPVARLTAVDGRQEFTYYVTPKTGEPVAMRVRFEDQTGPFTGTLTRFLAHAEDLTDTVLLRMRPHPIAKRYELRQTRC